MSEKMFYYKGHSYNDFDDFCKAVHQFDENPVSHAVFLEELSSMATDVFYNLETHDKIPTGAELLKFKAFFFQSAITKLLG
jgi:hypothetical protein